VIGHGHGGHAKFLHALAQFVDITSAIEQGIVRVQMQVNELGHWVKASLTQEGSRKTVNGCAFQGRL
jgi:isopentenyl phosphate kinase